MVVAMETLLIEKKNVHDDIRVIRKVPPSLEGIFSQICCDGVKMQNQPEFWNSSQQIKSSTISGHDTWWRHLPPSTIGKALASTSWLQLCLHQTFLLQMCRSNFLLRTKNLLSKNPRKLKIRNKIKTYDISKILGSPFDIHDTLAVRRILTQETFRKARCSPSPYAGHGVVNWNLSSTIHYQHLVKSRVLVHSEHWEPPRRVATVKRQRREATKNFRVHVEDGTAHNRWRSHSLLRTSVHNAERHRRGIVLKMKAEMKMMEMKVEGIKAYDAPLQTWWGSCCRARIPDVVYLVEILAACSRIASTHELHLVP